MAINSSVGATFINPEEVIIQMEIRPDTVVADFGCGTGYFVFPIARRLSGGGRVYALDIMPAKLETVESQSKILGLTNVITQRVNLEKVGGSKLDPESVDWVILADMLFQNKDKGGILNEAKRVLKNDGKILAIEWASENMSVGPDKKLRISKDSLLKIAQKNSLKLIKEIQAGDFHYGLVLTK